MAVAFSVVGTVAGAESNGTRDRELAQDFRKSTNGVGAAYAASVAKLRDRVGLKAGNGSITVDEVGRANYQTLVRDIASIGAAFDAVTTYPSNDAKLGTWALGLFAKGYDDNPSDPPISIPIALLFIAAGLIFLPLVYAVAGQTIFGTPGVVPGVDDLVQLIEPALRSAAQSKTPKASQPLVSPADQQGIRDALAMKGVSGGALDLMTPMLTLTASLVIADARR